MKLGYNERREKSVKCDVEYSLDNNVREQIVKIKELCIDILGSVEIFLFGSIAKGQYKKSSDIDILILIKENKSIKEIRSIKNYIEDEIEKIKIERSVDIKIYNKDRYKELSKDISFEQDIIKDLIDIRRW